MTWEIKAARAGLHIWEEPCISGKRGSGTVFFSGCSLKCIYCQNHEIALGNTGIIITEEKLSDIFMRLEVEGAQNINLVTPTHYIISIRKALMLAKDKGLSIPVVYNTGGYESAKSLRLLDGLVDIYMPDMKYYDTELSKNFSSAPDYFDRATEAIEEMYAQTGEVCIDNGMMTSGLIVRHMVLPGHTNDSKKVLKYLYERYKNKIMISILGQYTPVVGSDEYKELNRKLTKREYDKVINYAIELGIDNGFIQEGDTAKDSFIPSFDCCGLI